MFKLLMADHPLLPHPFTHTHTHTHTHTLVQAKRDEQMLKRRNVNVGPEAPLTESNKQVITIFIAFYIN